MAPGKGCGYVELSFGAYAPGDTVPQSLSGQLDLWSEDELGILREVVARKGRDSTYIITFAIRFLLRKTQEVQMSMRLRRLNRSRRAW